MEPDIHEIMHALIAKQIVIEGGHGDRIYVMLYSSTVAYLCNSAFQLRREQSRTDACPSCFRATIGPGRNCRDLENIRDLYEWRRREQLRWNLFGMEYPSAWRWKRQLLVYNNYMKLFYENCNRGRWGRETTLKAVDELVTGWLSMHLFSRQPW